MLIFQNHIIINIIANMKLFSNIKSNQYLQIWGVFLAFIGPVLFSTKAVLVKIAYRDYDIDAISLLLFRMAFALPIYLIIAVVISRKKRTYQLTRKDYIQILTLGIAGYYLASLFDFIGLQYITASLERLVLFIYPTIVVLIGMIFFKEKISQKQVLALILTYIGIVIVFMGNVDITSQRDLWIGSSLIFFCAITYAIYFVGSGQLLPKIGTWLYTSYVLTVSCVAVILHYLIHNKGVVNLDYPMGVYIIGFLMATFATVIPTLITSEAIRIIGASNSAIIASVGPISTITLAYFFLNERLAPVQFFGGLLVLGGVVFISLQQKKK